MQAKLQNAADIHHDPCQVFCNNVNDKKRRESYSIVTDKLVQKVEQWTRGFDFSLSL